MHYDGDLALKHCASKLNLQPSQHVLDVGSGFSATGRFLASEYGARVIGIELQRENHDIAERIIVKNVGRRIVEGVRSVNADFLSLTPESLGAVVVGGGGGGGGGSSNGEAPSAQFDHVVSFLCILHMPASARSPLFLQAARFLHTGGRMYIEDFYDRSGTASHLTAKELRQLHEVVACPYLPSASVYIADVEAAGFDRVEFEDVSEKWAGLVRERAEKYRADEEMPNAALQEFYDTVAELFEGGNVGGVRLTAVRR